MEASHGHVLETGGSCFSLETLPTDNVFVGVEKNQDMCSTFQGILLAPEGNASREKMITFEIVAAFQ